MTKEDLVAILIAYRSSVEVACPGLHPDIDDASNGWPYASEAALARELERRLVEASDPTCSVRLFFKIGIDLVYGGCNRQFATDAGLAGSSEIVGLNDFDARIAWVSQAAKYRKDDREVIQSCRPKLGIIERQNSAAGVIWLDTSKMPVLVGSAAIGIFGTYEVIDAKTAFSRSRSRRR